MKNLSRSGFAFASFFLTLMFVSCATPQVKPSDEGALTAEAAAPIVYDLPSLAYSYKALEPHLDAKTMEIHYDKHHRAYVTNLNKALEGTVLISKPLEEIFLMNDMPTAVRNNGGGHYNHSLFWSVMTPTSRGGGKLQAGDLKVAIEKDFGGFEKFQEVFTQSALTRFGSGWAWLVLTSENKLAVTSTNAQDNPLMTIDGVVSGTPILGLDVWEHAYYLKFQNRRADFIKAWWNVVNWVEVESRYKSALQTSKK